MLWSVGGTNHWHLDVRQLASAYLRRTAAFLRCNAADCLMAPTDASRRHRERTLRQRIGLRRIAGCRPFPKNRGMHHARSGPVLAHQVEAHQRSCTGRVDLPERRAHTEGAGVVICADDLLRLIARGFPGFFVPRSKEPDPRSAPRPPSV